MGITLIEDVAARSSTHAKDNTRTYSRRWEVNLDGTNASPKSVENLWVLSTGIVLASPYSCAGDIDLGARALDIAVKCIAEDGYTYEVTCNYGKWEYDNTNPLLQLPKFNYQFSDNMKIVEEDKDGKPILNSAKQPFSDPLEIYDPQLILSVSDWNVASEPTWLGPYRNAVNSDTWRGYGPRYWRVADVQVGHNYDVDYGHYWTISLGFHFNAEKWDLRPLSKGYKQLVTENGVEKLEDIQVSAKATTEPMLLDKDGKALPDGDETNKHFMTYRCYPELPFAGVFAW